MAPTAELAPLALTLLDAAHVCVAVRAGHTLREALRRGAAAQSDARRGAVQDLCYRTMRNRGRADAILALFAARLPQPALLRELLVVALALLDRAGPRGDGAPRPYSDFTLVDQTVGAARLDPATRHGAGFVNAVLRGVLREPERVEQALPAAQAVVQNYPAWWVAELRGAYGATADAILAEGQKAPSMTLRVNRRRIARDAYAALLEAGALAAAPLGAAGMRLAEPVPVERLPGFFEGLVSVQDEGAQRAAFALDLADDMDVLDACAAPGGKTGHILELARARVTALDSDGERLQRVADNLSRLGLAARLVEGDAAAPAGWWDGQPFDRVLADLPCSASGIVRRHPDIRWLRRAGDPVALSRGQQHILDGLWQVVKPGGKLLLVTCSVFPEEGQGLAREFAMRHGDAAAVPTWGQLLPSSGPNDDHDGLFFALFDKVG